MVCKCKCAEQSPQVATTRVTTLAATPFLGEHLFFSPRVWRFTHSRASEQNSDALSRL